MAYVELKKTYYTPAEIARMVGVSRQTVVKWIERGELNGTQTAGGHWRVPASEVKGGDAATVRRVGEVPATATAE